MMTMLSFRVEDEEAAEVQRWADELQVDRSQILRDALRREIVRLAGERDARIWEEQPLTAEEQALQGAESWLPAEDWSDWLDAAR